MKKFTVKDFINYNAPCFSCDRKITIRVGSICLTQQMPAVYLRATVTTTQTEVDLQVTYARILKLIINHTTNKITTSDPEALTKYLKVNKLFLSSVCNHCYTSIESAYLEFNLQEAFIKPVSISQEMLMLSDSKSLYQIISKSIDEETIIVVDRINKANSITPIRFVLPLSLLYKLKDKEHILQKIKTYLLFS
jgi:hypothetical protein